MLISIITPCFNSEKTIEKTLQNVLNQTYQNFEYIIIDGASTDGTLDIIENYKEKFADKLTVVSEKDNGVYDAMNKGIKLAKGELIGIINSDDYYELDALENIVNEYQNEKYAVIYGMMRTYLDGKESTVSLYHHNFLEQQMMNHPACFVTKATYDDFGVYRLDYKCASDYDLLLRLKQKTDVVFKPVYKIISNFSFGGISYGALGEEERDAMWHEYGFISTKKYIVKKYYNKILRFAKRKFLKG